jgi:uncharacterized cupredoxin-like copper-binding protein
MPRLASLATIAALAVALAGCGGSDNNNSTTASAAGGTSTAPAPGTDTSGVGGVAAPVDVELKDFAIVPSSDSFKQGKVTFNARNTGNTQHNLTIKGPGVSDEQTSTFGPGASDSVTVNVAAGSYELYCSVPGHKAAGMDLTITVT